MSIDLEPRTDATPAARVASDRPSGSRVLLPRLPPRRNPRLIALGVLALCLGALLSYVIYARVAAETTVVSASRTVYRGEMVERGDLGTVRLRADSLPGAVPAADLEQLVGQRAVFDLPAGAVVSAGLVSSSAVLEEGRAAVGIKLVDGKAPPALLLPAAPIRLVALPPASTATSETDELGGRTYLARVISHVPGPDGASILLDVEVEQAQAATVALLAAQERIAVVRDAGR